MPHIKIEDGLPGIMGLLEYRLDTAAPIRELTHILLRGESTLTEGERELIATIVSHGNECRFCATAHTAAANELLGESETTEAIKKDIENAPVSEKMKALLVIASKVQKSGRLVSESDIERAHKYGATDMEIHDTVLIAALFCLYNRYVDGLATWTPKNQKFYNGLAKRLAQRGYTRPEQGYSNFKYHKSDETED